MVALDHYAGVYRESSYPIRRGLMPAPRVPRLIWSFFVNTLIDPAGGPERRELEWNRALVERSDAADGMRAADYLKSLARGVAPAKVGDNLPAAFHQAEPLLYQLIASVLKVAPPGVRMD